MVCLRCGKELDSGRATHGLHEHCFIEWFGLESFEDFSEVVVRSSSQQLLMDEGRLLKKMTSFFHGKFKKYSATLGGTTYILKVKQDDYPELPGTEYLCNQIAQDIGIEVPQYFYVRFQNSLETFVSRSFMHDYPGGNLIHIYNYLKGDDEFTCEHLIRVIGDKTGRLPDIERFVALCLFDSLIGNNDRHGRNLGLIQTPKGFQLSPCFDNPSYLGTESEDLLGADISPRGTIATSETTEPSMVDYIREFRRLGYGEVVAEFSKKISAVDIQARVRASFISAKRQQAISTLIEKRLRELRNGS